MTSFPVTASTLSAKELGVFIKNKYELNQNYQCELFRTGINHTYFVGDGTSKYALRVYTHNWRSKTEISQEIQLLNLLKKNSLGVSFPIKDKNGEFIQKINAPEGIRHAVLFSFAEGKKTRFIDKQTCFAIGVLMAKIHKVTLNQAIDRITYDRDTLLNQPYKYLKPFFTEGLPEMQFIKKTSAEMDKVFQKTNRSGIKNGIVHLDIWYDNLNVSDKQGITIFDFDFCGNGWQVLDIAYFCKQLFHIETTKEVYEQKKNSFLSGYQSILKLSNDELNLIPDMGVAVFIFYLGVQAQRFDWSNIFLSENYLKMYVGKLKSWVEYHIH